MLYKAGPNLLPDRLVSHSESSPTAGDCKIKQGIIRKSNCINKSNMWLKHQWTQTASAGPHYSLGKWQRSPLHPRLQWNKPWTLNGFILYESNQWFLVLFQWKVNSWKQRTRIKVSKCYCLAFTDLKNVTIWKSWLAAAIPTWSHLLLTPQVLVVIVCKAYSTYLPTQPLNSAF